MSMNWHLATDPREPDEGVPQSWYPLCRTTDVKPGQIKPVDLFGGHWVLYRDAQDAPQLISRYCPHMGTDLAGGDVVDGKLRCQMHHLRFGPCKPDSKPDGKPGAKPGVLTPASLPVEEHYGMIFVFWGERPLFPFPQIPDWDAAIAPPIIVEFPCDYRAVILNGFDLAHLPAVHGRTVSGDYHMHSDGPLHLHISYKAEVMPDHWFDRLQRWLGHTELDASYDNFGGSLFKVSNRSGGYVGLFSVRPVALDRCYYCMIVMRPRRTGLLSRFTQPLGLRVMNVFVRAFLDRDKPALRNMRVFASKRDDAADEASLRFWQYFRNLPRRLPLDHPQAAAQRAAQLVHKGAAE